MHDVIGFEDVNDCILKLLVVLECLMLLKTWRTNEKAH